MILAEILVPLLNANEPEARVAAIYHKDGEFVEKGKVLFTIETTKVVSEIESPSNGYLRVFVKEDQTITVGEQMAVLSDIADEPVMIGSKSVNDDDLGRKISTKENSQAIRITKPARKLASSLGIDLSILPTDKLITEDIVKRFHNQKTLPLVDLGSSEKESIVIYGGGGHAKTIIDLLLTDNQYHIAGIIDDNPSMRSTKIFGYQVLGTRDILPSILEQGVKYAANCVGGILDLNIRVDIFTLLSDLGFLCPALFHPSGDVEHSAKIGNGVQVLAKSYIGSDTVLHDFCLINTNAVVSHDCNIGSYTHIAPGALLAGSVSVGERTLVGMGVTTSIGVRIGDNVRIGNGAIVIADVPDRTIIQAGRYWTGKAG